jgi:membrane complex biogenesis BtpA family protein
MIDQDLSKSVADCHRFSSEEKNSVDKLAVINSLFGVPRALIGVVHLHALPGTPSSELDIASITSIAVEEARQYEDAGFHGVMIENTHDRPYLKAGVGPEITAAMAVIGAEIRRAVALPLGIQVLAGANTNALAVALACGASFVRVEGFVFAHVADEGLIEGSAALILRYRRAIDADHIRVFADVKKKHSAHAITADIDIAETAKAAEFFLVDGVIVTGIATGQPAEPDEVNAVARAVSVPTIVGSGITSENLSHYPDADAFIVGSSIKKDGLWSNPIDPDRARALVRAFGNG